MSQLTNYIQKELDKGFSKDLISKKLLQAGYTQQEITESFSSLKSAEPLLRRKSIEMPHMEFHIKWSRWVFGLLAVLVVGVFGYLVYTYEGEISLPLEKTASCNTVTDSREKDSCYLSLAAQGEDTCSLIQSKIIATLCTQKVWETDYCNYLFFIGGDKEACLLERAIETKDPAYCNRKASDDVDCLVKLALEIDDPTLCGHEMFCYQKYAVATQDKNVCELVPEEEYKDPCLDYYKLKLEQNQ